MNVDDFLDSESLNEIGDKGMIDLSKNEEDSKVSIFKDNFDEKTEDVIQNKKENVEDSPLNNNNKQVSENYVDQFNNLLKGNQMIKALKYFDSMLGKKLGGNFKLKINPEENKFLFDIYNKYMVELKNLNSECKKNSLKIKELIDKSNIMIDKKNILEAKKTYSEALILYKKIPEGLIENYQKLGEELYFLKNSILNLNKENFKNNLVLISQKIKNLIELSENNIDSSDFVSAMKNINLANDYYRKVPFEFLKEKSILLENILKQYNKLLVVYKINELEKEIPESEKKFSYKKDKSYESSFDDIIKNIPKPEDLKSESKKIASEMPEPPVPEYVEDKVLEKEEEEKIESRKKQNEDVINEKILSSQPEVKEENKKLEATENKIKVSEKQEEKVVSLKSEKEKSEKLNNEKILSSQPEVKKEIEKIEVKQEKPIQKHKLEKEKITPDKVKDLQKKMIFSIIKLDILNKNHEKALDKLLEIEIKFGDDEDIGDLRKQILLRISDQEKQDFLKLRERKLNALTQSNKVSEKEKQDQEKVSQAYIKKKLILSEIYFKKNNYRKAKEIVNELIKEFPKDNRIKQVKNKLEEKIGQNNN